MQSLLPLSAAGTVRNALSDVITTCRKAVPVLLLTGYSKENIVLPSDMYIYLYFYHNYSLQCENVNSDCKTMGKGTVFHRQFVVCKRFSLSLTIG